MTLHVVYRSTGGENEKSRPPYYTKLVCLLSFLRSIEEVGEPVDTIFLNDGPIPEDRLDLMGRSGELLEMQGIGKLRSYRAALGLLDTRQWQDDEIVYFLEDDYLHTAAAIGTLIAAAAAIPEASYFTLYDCPDRYTRDDDADGGRALVFIGGDRHWRTVESTTHTFAARVGTMRADSWLHWLATRQRVRGTGLLRRSSDPPYVAEDRATWRVVQGLGEYRLAHALVHLMGARSGVPRDRAIARFKLRSFVRPTQAPRLLVGPMPSLATHAEEPFLAPIIDWAEVAAGSLDWATRRGLMPRGTSRPAKVREAR